MLLCKKKKKMGCQGGAPPLQLGIAFLKLRGFFSHGVCMFSFGPSEACWDAISVFAQSSLKI
jgi:hypothetical protein